MLLLFPAIHPDLYYACDYVCAAMQIACTGCEAGPHLVAQKLIVQALCISVRQMTATDMGETTV